MDCSKPLLEPKETSRVLFVPLSVSGPEVRSRVAPGFPWESGKRSRAWCSLELESVSMDSLMGQNLAPDSDAR